MFIKVQSNEKIGAYLHKLVKGKYESDRKFCQAYLRLQDIEPTDEETRKMHNRFCQIFNGKKSIQVHDLPVVTRLLGVSCEEILSARKQCLPSPSPHITNYDIARSDKREVWEEYMKREDKLFLNCDEYRKSVIDYALEFKNYKFMKYLLEEGYIWPVDPNKELYTGNGFSTDTKLPFSGQESRFFNMYLKDQLRTQTIALAIEFGDCEVLDQLRAREVPELPLLTIYGNQAPDYFINKNDDLIEAIAFSGEKKILEYFSKEFVITDHHKREHAIMFPFINQVIDIMLENNNETNAELFIRNSIDHNKEAFRTLSEMIKKACQQLYDTKKEQIDKLINACLKTGYNANDERLINKLEKEAVAHDLIFDNLKIDKNDNVSFLYYDNGIAQGFATNLVKVTSKKGSAETKELVKELNEWYNKVISLGGEKYAEILL